MKKLFTLSALLSVASATVLSVNSASAQTVPIVSGTIVYSFSGNGSVSLSNVVTSIGVVSITANSLNGNITNSISNSSQMYTDILTSSVLNGTFNFANGQANNNITFVGTSSGTSPNGSFTNTPTTFVTINAARTFVTNGVSFPITSGTIALTLPASESASGNFLPVTSNLQIANSTLPSSDKSNPEYRQEYNNGFSSPSSSRILPLDIK